MRVVRVHSYYILERDDGSILSFSEAEAHAIANKIKDAPAEAVNEHLQRHFNLTMKASNP